MSSRKLLSAFFALVAFVARGTTPAWKVRFVDVTEQAGIRFVHDNGAQGEHRFPETIGSGAAWIDYNNDGWLDLYLVNAGNFQTGGKPNRLYRNNGDGTFTDVTEAAGVGDTGFGAGAVAADYNGDGWVDLYVCNFQQNTLYRNNGDGTFTDVTEEAGVGDPRWSASAVFLDIENDGDLDLFVASYAQYRPEWDRCEVQGMPVYCGPEVFEGERDTLYRNNGDGTFTDVSEAAGITVPGLGLAAIAGDVDRDGDADLFVANDMTPNLFYRNNGDGTFQEVGFLAGVALGDDAVMGNSMGFDLADYNNDGLLDLIVTNFDEQTTVLHRNDGDGFFTDVSYLTGIGGPSFSVLSWGCAIVDLDNDGWRDIFIVNGHIHDNIRQIKGRGSYPQPKQVFQNLANGRFRDVSAESGEPIVRPEVSRGAAFADYDNDGDVDVIVNNLGGRATLLRNESPGENGWVRVVLEPPAMAVGAWLELSPEAGDIQWVAQVHAGGSYASSNDPRVLFGVGHFERLFLTARWRDGTRVGPLPVQARETVRLRYPDRRE